jgi:hypothetical protein
MAGPSLGLIDIAVFVVAIVFLVWYYAAFVYSRRLAARVARELKGAVLGLGGTSQVRWFGTAAFRMSTEGANPPFKEFAVTVTLRPREMPINWAIGTARGRRDSALIEASLRTQPKVAFELVDPATRIGRRRRRARSDWSPVSIGGRDLLLAGEDVARVVRLLEGFEAEALETLLAIHVSAGGTPGIAASMSVKSGDAARGLAAIRAFANRLVG